MNMLFSITLLQFDTLFYLCFNLNMREFDLKNNIRACVRENKNTPRVALTLNFSISVPEKYSGDRRQRSSQLRGRQKTDHRFFGCRQRRAGSLSGRQPEI